MSTIIHPESCRLGVMPVPLQVVLVSYTDQNESCANITTVSYAGQLSSCRVYVSLRPSRHAFERMRNAIYFGVNYLTPEQAQIADYCGIVSGRNVDKFKATGLTKECFEGSADIPLVGESPVSLVCSLRNHHDEGTHHVFVGDVVRIVQRDPNARFLLHQDFQYVSSDNIPLGSVLEIGKGFKPLGGAK